MMSNRSKSPVGLLSAKFNSGTQQFTAFESAILAEAQKFCPQLVTRRVREFRYFPHYQDADIAIFHGDVSPKEVDLVVERGCIERIWNVHGYCNIKLRTKSVLSLLPSLYRSALEDTKQRAVIEHTSLTPVFPLNAATYRGSVIGDVYARVLKYAGYDVHVVYWMEDTSRHAEIVVTLCRDEILVNKISRSSQGGVCHSLAHLLAATVHRNQLEVSADTIRTLFQKSIVSDEEVFRFLAIAARPGDELSLNVRTLFQAIERDVSELFQRLGFITPEFIIESENRNATILKYPQYTENFKYYRSEKYAFSTSDPKYFSKNVIFFLSLVKQYDRVIVVVNEAQRELVECARDCLNGSDEQLSLIPIYFTPNLIDGALDSIRDLQFHCIEAEIARLSREYNLTLEAAKDLSRLICIGYPPLEHVDLRGAGVQEWLSLVLSVEDLLPQLSNGVESEPTTSNLGIELVLLCAGLPRLIKNIENSADISKAVKFLGCFTEEILEHRKLVSIFPSCIRAAFGDITSILTPNLSRITH